MRLRQSVRIRVPSLTFKLPPTPRSAALSPEHETSFSSVVLLTRDVANTRGELQDWTTSRKVEVRAWGTDTEAALQGIEVLINVLVRLVT